MKNFLNDLVKPLTDLTDSNMWRKLRYFFKEWVFPVAIALIIVLFLNKFVFILVTSANGLNGRYHHTRRQTICKRTV